MIAPVDVTGVRLETDRLILRPWKKSDVQDFYEYASVDGVGQRCGWLPHKSMEESRMILSRFIEGKHVFALEHQGKVIGSLGIELMDPDPVEGEGYGREIGYVLSKDFWGRGLMTEAVKAVIAYCFETLGYDYLTCGHFIQNDRSRRVIEKCGFTYFGDSGFETHYGTVETSRNYMINNPNK